MAIILPYRRLERPGGPLTVNWAHPSARGLRVVWDARNPGQIIGEFRRDGTLNSLAQHFNDSVTVQDVANAGVQFGTVQPLRLTYEMTFLAVAAPRNQARPKSAIVQRLASGSYPQAGLVFNMDGTFTTAAGWICSMCYASTPQNEAFNISPLINGTTRCYAFSRAHQRSICAVDGAILTTGATSLNVNYVDAAQKFTIGNSADHTGTGYSFDDPLFLVLAWDRMLQSAELAELTAAPWQIFQRRTDQIIFPVSSVTYPTLSDLKAVNITGSSVQATVDYAF